MKKTMNTTKIRTYTELSSLPTFEERFRYLKLSGEVGVATFGGHRYLNQMLYRSPEWKRVKRDVIIRDSACDLGLTDHPIYGVNIIVHHMNPITVDDIINRSEFVFNPEYLISTILSTHNAIHYGTDELLVKTIVERRPNDTIPWRN